ncbi:MAG: hypothetical protein AMXMBFR61_02140 [Fimbriimonadales bacterium]
MKRALVALLVLVFAACVFAQQVEFHGHKVIRTYITKPSQLTFLEKLNVDFWSERPDLGPVDVRVTPEQLKRVEQARIPYMVLIEDLQKLIDSQKSDVQAQGIFDDYLTLDQINDQLLAWEQQYPALAKRIQVGTSVQNRPIYVLRLSTGVNQTDAYGSKKLGVLYHGAEHAREWISPPVVLYIANYLLTNYGVDKRATDILNHMDVYCMPVMNPDGYRYTWTNNRMWRKNRRNNGDGTYGVDLNRNWGYMWGGDGSSGNTSSETYRGPSPFSEPETRAVRDFLLANPRVKGHLDYHSYSQLILFPWGYTSAQCPDYAAFLSATGRMATLINQVHGMVYDYGSVGGSLYLASGCSLDWSYAVAGTRAITIELRDTGEYGFVLPKEQIIPTCEENLPAAIDYALWLDQVYLIPARKR